MSGRTRPWLFLVSVFSDVNNFGKVDEKSVNNDEVSLVLAVEAFISFATDGREIRSYKKQQELHCNSETKASPPDLRRIDLNSAETTTTHRP